MNMSKRFDAKKLGYLFAALGGFSVLAPLSAWAQEGIDGGLKLESARRHFVRFGYTYIKPTDKVGVLKDKTGPVISYNELKAMHDGTLYTTGSASGNYLNLFNASTNPTGQPRMTNSSLTNNARSIFENLYQGMTDDYTARGYDVNNMPDSAGLGVPTGTAQVATGAGTPTISAGMFLDEDYKWAAEAYIFALPFTNKIKGAGRIGGDTATYPGVLDPGSTDYGKGGATQLGIIATTQQLPLTAIGHYYFGNKNDKLRMSLGLGVSYAIFFNTQSSKSQEDYSGGPTTIKIKNAFGAGPFVGAHYKLGDNWSLSASLGYLKMKTSATVTTKVDPYTMGASVANFQAAGDIAPAGSGNEGATVGAISLGNTVVGTGLSGANLTTARNYYGASATVAQGSLLALAKARAATYGGDSNTLGTYVRTVDAVLDPYVLTVAIGYEF